MFSLDFDKVSHQGKIELQYANLLTPNGKIVADEWNQMYINYHIERGSLLFIAEGEKAHQGSLTY